MKKMILLTDAFYSIVKKNNKYTYALTQKFLDLYKIPKLVSWCFQPNGLKDRRRKQTKKTNPLYLCFNEFLVHDSFKNSDFKFSDINDYGKLININLGSISNKKTKLLPEKLHRFEFNGRMQDLWIHNQNQFNECVIRQSYGCINCHHIDLKDKSIEVLDISTPSIKKFLNLSCKSLVKLVLNNEVKINIANCFLPKIRLLDLSKATALHLTFKTNDKFHHAHLLFNNSDNIRSSNINKKISSLLKKIKFNCDVIINPECKIFWGLLKKDENKTVFCLAKNLFCQKQKNKIIKIQIKDFVNLYFQQCLKYLDNIKDVLLKKIN